MKNKFFESLSQGDKDIYSEAKVVSFDIFDTVVTRLVAAPKHIFSLVADRAKTILTNEQFKKFVLYRIEAEERARKAAKNEYREEVTLKEIYLQLKLLLNLNSPITEKIIQFESEIELENIIAIEPMLITYKKAISDNKRVIFVSDMYLDRVNLEEILSKCGFIDYEKIYVSSEIKLTKSSGRLWNYVINSLDVEPQEILHFGDSSWGDIMRAKENGLNTVHFPYLAQDQKNRNNFDPSTLTLSKFVQKNRINDIFCTDMAKKIGENYLSVMYMSYVKWIAENASKTGVNNLLFLSRDGYILKKVWDILSEKNLVPKNIQASYLQVSRKSLIMSSIVELTPSTIDFLISGGEKDRSVRTFVERTGIKISENILFKINSVFSTPEHIVSSSDDYINLRQLFGDLRQEILEFSTQSRINVIKYFESFKIFESNSCTAIVDLGWQGNMQSAIKKIINFVDVNISISGFYFGLWRNALGKVYSSGSMKGMICNGLQHPDYERKLIQLAPVLEALHSAPHGSVKGYENVDGEIVVLHQDYKTEKKVYEEIISNLHHFALASIDNIASGKSNINFDELSIKLCKEVLEEVLVLPNIRELEVLGKIRHLDGFEHSGEGVSLVPYEEAFPKNEDDAFKIMSKYHFWVPGVLAFWKKELNHDKHKVLSNLSQNYRYLGQDWIDSIYH
ncbi:hypothetical protein VRB37_19635 [Erwinia billingiae]|uniref:hypothetical protein n=1 Tax=Erwinia billingiae TaxID=182337 RepID=UPI0030CB9182